MEDDDFEWDDQNAADHFAKHGVSFEQHEFCWCCKGGPLGGPIAVITSAK